MSIEELKEKAYVGFDGKMFYMALYQGETYLAWLVNGIFALSSEKPIKFNSEKYGDYYETDMRIKELDYITGYTMYVTYKGNEYEVGGISPRLALLDLQGREDHLEEDLSLGFEREMYKHMYFLKQIVPEEADSFRIESRDVYLELMEKYGDK